MENKSVYKVLYPWEVEGKIKEGKIVNMLDRKSETISIVNEMNASQFIALTTEKDETNRYEFWYYDQSSITRGETKK